MDKLVEREAAAARTPLSGAPALAVQFFLIPLAVVAVTAGIYVGFRSMLASERTVQEALDEVRAGGRDRQWPAAYELSQLMSDPKVRADRSFVPALVKAFDEAREGDPRVRQYLALAIGRLGSPLPREAIDALMKSLDEPARPWSPDLMSRFNGWTETDGSDARIMTIWALGSSGDPSVVDRLRELYASEDAGIRKMVVYALGALPGERQIATLKTALNDAAADIQWNAAVALARHGQNDGVPVIQRMLDRDYLATAVRAEAGVSEDEDPAGDVMITGLQAAAALGDASLRAPVERISQADRNMRVRQAALEALKTFGEPKEPNG